MNGDFGRLEPAHRDGVTWRDFLTERDRQHLAKRHEKTEPFGFGTRPAVVVIDMYYNAVGLTREPILESIERAPMSCGLEGWDAIDRTAELLELARTHRVEVIYVKSLDPPARLDGKNPRIDALNSAADAELRRRSNDIVTELMPRAGEKVFQKPAPSAFFCSPLPVHLRSQGIDTLICCGETTSGCVRATVVDGASLRYRMGVVEECVFDRTEMSHHVNLFDMNQKSADVVSLRDVAEYFADVKPA